MRSPWRQTLSYPRSRKRSVHSTSASIFIRLAWTSSLLFDCHYNQDTHRKSTQVQVKSPKFKAREASIGAFRKCRKSLVRVHLRIGLRGLGLKLSKNLFVSLFLENVERSSFNYVRKVTAVAKTSNFLALFGLRNQVPKVRGHRHSKSIALIFFCTCKKNIRPERFFLFGFVTLKGFSSQRMANFCRKNS